MKDYSIEQRRVGVNSTHDPKEILQNVIRHSEQKLSCYRKKANPNPKVIKDNQQITQNLKFTHAFISQFKHLDVWLIIEQKIKEFQKIDPEISSFSILLSREGAKGIPALIEMNLNG